MKTPACFLSCALALLWTFAAGAPSAHAVATNLAPGDVALVGYSSGMSDGTGRPPIEDRIHFVLLKAIGSGTVIYLTDRTWTPTAGSTTLNAGAFSVSGTDGTYLYTAASDVAAGTVVSITQAQLSAAGFDFNHSTGEAIYVFQGTNANTPTAFLYAAELADGNATFAASLGNTGLIAGLTTVAVSFDCAAYHGPTIHAESFMFNGVASTLLHSVADSTNWVGDDQDGQNAIEQEIQTGPWLTHPDVDFWGTMAGVDGISRTRADATVGGGADDFNHTRLYDDLLVGGFNIWTHLRDMVFDTVDGKFFLVDSNIQGVNRILQGNISDLLANPSQAPALIVLFTQTVNDITDFTGRLDNLDIDLANNIIYFTHGSNLDKIVYNTPNQAPTTLFRANVTNATSPSGVGNPAGSASNFYDDMVVNFTTNKIYLSSRRVVSASSGDLVTKNFIYELSGLTTSSGTDAFQFNASNTGTARLLPMTPNDDTYNPNPGATSSPASSAQAPYFFPMEYGSCDGLAIDPATNTLYVSTGELLFDHDLNSGTPPLYASGVVAAYALSGNPTGTYTLRFHADGQRHQRCAGECVAGRASGERRHQSFDRRPVDRRRRGCKSRDAGDDHARGQQWHPERPHRRRRGRDRQRHGDRDAEWHEDADQHHPRSRE